MLTFDHKFYTLPHSLDLFPKILRFYLQILTLSLKFDFYLKVLYGPCLMHGQHLDRLVPQNNGSSLVQRISWNSF